MAGLLVFFVVFWADRGLAYDQEHETWNRVLRDCLRSSDGGRISRMDYRCVETQPSDIERYISTLSRVTKAEYEAWKVNDQLAFLLNTYNAFTVKLVVDHYPVKSIKDIGSFFSSPWKKTWVPLLGKTLSLDEIEHGIIRKNFREPRIHFAVNCASVGCPPLRAEAYEGSRLDEQLAEQRQFFLTNERENRFYPDKKELVLSKIFSWYGDDFGSEGDKSLIAYAAKSIPALQKALDRGQKVEIRYGDYDWSLNDSVTKSKK